MTRKKPGFPGVRDHLLLLIVTLSVVAPAYSADEPLLLLNSRPTSDLAVLDVDFSLALDRGDVDADKLSRVQAFDVVSGTRLKVQYVPGPIEDSSIPSTVGTLVLKLPDADVTEVRLAFQGPPFTIRTTRDFAVDMSGATVTHAAQDQAGMPSQFVFRKTGRVFKEFTWNDRLYHKQLGGFLLRHDSAAKVTIASDGPLCTVVRVEAAYKRADGTQPTSKPTAVFDWYYFHDQPLAFVRATVSQETEMAWNEVHFLELNFPGRDFERWLGGEPGQSGQLVGDGSSHRLADWAAVRNDNDAIAMFGCGRVLIHDGRGAYGTYLHAAGDRSWESWDGTTRKYSGWICAGHHDDTSGAVKTWMTRLPIEISGVLTSSAVHSKIQQARQDAERLEPAERAARWWRVAIAERLESEGKLQQAVAALDDHLPDNWTVISAGDMRFTVVCRDGGIQPVSLFDAARDHEHLATSTLPLFDVTLRNTDTAEEVTLHADHGWRETAVVRAQNGATRLRWQSPDNESLGGLSVLARVEPDQKQHALRWRLSITGLNKSWSLWRVRFPQVELVAPGTEPALLFPRGPGEVKTDVWRRAFSFSGTYPSGWTSMQFMASYDRQSGGGFYWAIHDSMGSTKDLLAKSHLPAGTVVLSAEHPVPNMGQGGNGFQLPGEAVWQFFSGDWYDAAQIYRQWVRTQAKWYPELGEDGREDTPGWMRELCVWAQTGGKADQCVDQVRRFAEFLGVPVGFHWYSWHEIPFDNDYPHYFPTTEGFADGVRKLNDANVYVMPYINGRLWDTRDRGTEDYEFTKRALQAATKEQGGEPFTEVYGSKEKDGSPVRLAVMCPTTSTWQNEIAGIVSRLFDECNVNGIYIDQIAAAAPKTCMDPAHGHPTGGGHWWNEGYWRMLEKIRQKMTPDQMLTSECNAEPFLRWFDGYLTWHWQYDGQVPVFPAVYGGSIQLFGRAYRGGETRDLALRMKSAQQLVYGEQIGWIHPNVVDQPENAEFLREVVRLRWHLRRYFYAGAMLRPPTISGTIPRVRADWQWRNEWWVETDALLTGTWHLPREKTLVAIFANVSDQPLEFTWTFDADKNGVPSSSSQVELRSILSSGPERPESVPAVFQKQMQVPARSVRAFEVGK